jgi:hypothetical protein
MDIPNLSNPEARGWIRSNAQAILDDVELVENLPDDILDALKSVLRPQPTDSQLEQGAEAVTVVLEALENAQATSQEALLAGLPDILKIWYKTPSWPASRRWLSEHLDELPPDAPEQFESAARAQESDLPQATAALQRHAALLREARATNVDSAYYAIIGNDAFAEEDEATASLAALVSLLQDWLNTPDWNASRIFLAAHAAELLTDDAEALLTLMSESEDDHDLQEILEDHANIIEGARQDGVDAAYEEFLAEYDDEDDEEDEDEYDEDDEDENEEE